MKSEAIMQCEYKKELNSFLAFLDKEKKKCFGIQMNQETTDSLDFSQFLRHTLNNLGDPFSGKGGNLHTFNYEKKLVNMVARLLSIEPNNAWGYYTSGSSISNLQAIHFATTILSNNVTLITSEDAHNSILKSARIVRVKKIIKVKTNIQGEIDINHFENVLKMRNKKDKLIFCFCSGTVSKGAYDNVEKLLEIISELGFQKENYYVHLDAALGGMITPYLTDRKLILDFRIPKIDSISISFHKRLGIPVPGSIFITRKTTLNSLNDIPFIEDYCSIDLTIPGSRDGLSPLITYFKLKKYGYKGMVEKTEKVINKAIWFATKLKENGIKKVLNNEYSPCVYFEAPNSTICKEYHLPIYTNEDNEKFTHVFTMEHVTNEELLKFIVKMKSY